jgi:hypothetical protein
MGDLSKAQHMAGFCSPSCFLPLIISIQNYPKSSVYHMILDQHSWSPNA